MNNKLPILIGATISLSILTTNISVNPASAKSKYESGYGGMGMEGMEGMEEWVWRVWRNGYGGYGGMGHGGAGQ